MTFLMPTDRDFYDSAYNLFDLKQYSQALSSIDISIQLNPKNIDALVLRATILIKMNRYYEALESADKAIAVNPKFVPAWNTRGILLDELNRPAEALAAFNNVIAIDPNNNLAFRFRADLLSRHKELNNSLSTTKTNVTIIKTDGSIVSNEVANGEAKQMTAAYGHALKAVNFEKEGSWYLAIGEHQNAINTASENDPNRAIYYTNLGVCYAKVGNKNRARENLETATRLDPNFKRARENLDALK